MSSDVKVTFANLNFAFIKFSEQLKTLCQTISESEKKDIYKSFKKVKSFVYEYLTYVREENIRTQIIKDINHINKQILKDTNYTRLSKSRDIRDIILFNQSYYNYYIELFKIVGLFGDELSSSFMPTKSDREKLLKYTNNNPFFEYFTFYKANVSEKLSNFNIFDFKNGFDYMIGFYFAYYSFIDESSRVLIEKIINNILGIVLDNKILALIITGYSNLQDQDRRLIKDIDNSIHDALTNIFSRCNYSYSDYGIMPKIQNKVIIDKTTI